MKIKLQQMREEAGLTQAEMSKKIGIPQASYAQIESRYISRSKYFKIVADYFNRPIEELLTVENEISYEKGQVLLNVPLVAPKGYIVARAQVLGVYANTLSVADLDEPEVRGIVRVDDIAPGRHIKPKVRTKEELFRYHTMVRNNNVNRRHWKGAQRGRNE